MLRIWITNIRSTWMCKKQTIVSRAESEIISLDEGLRMEGIPALPSWDCVEETFSHSDAKGNQSRTSGKRHSLSHSIDHVSFDTIDHVHSNIL